MPPSVFKTDEGSGNRLLVGSIPMRSRHILCGARGFDGTRAHRRLVLAGRFHSLGQLRPVFVEFCEDLSDSLILEFEEGLMSSRRFALISSLFS